MPNIKITQEYLRFRLVLTLLLLTFAIGAGYLITTRSFTNVIDKIEMVVVLDDALTVMTESLIHLDGLRHVEAYSAVEPLRTKIHRSSQRLQDVVQKIEQKRSSGTIGPEVTRLLENDTLDIAGLLLDFHFVSTQLAEPDAPWGHHADRLVKAAHATTDQILPVLRRLNALELEELEQTNSNMQIWLKLLVISMLSVLIGIGVFVFLPMEKNILDSHYEILQRQKLAEAASIAKSDFLSTMSHEIRTPMNGVLGMAEILNNTSLETEQQQMVQVIQDSGRNLMVIIEDILDFSKIEANKLTLENRPFKLRAVLAHLSKLMEPMIADKGLEYSINVDGNLAETHMGDAVRIQQILTNLLGNAIKFTITGSVVVNVFVEPVSNGYQKVRVGIVDTGIGIDETKLEQIFEQFEQADNTSTRRFGGTGLGLAISASLADAMNGKITVKSVVGLGSTFTFEADFEVAGIVSDTQNTDTSSEQGTQYTLTAHKKPETGTIG